MSDAPERIPELTRAQKKVLADLLLFRNSRNVTQLSYTQLAETTGLKRATVVTVIHRLNDLNLVRSEPMPRLAPSRHLILRTVRVLPEPVSTTPPQKAGRS